MILTSFNLVFGIFSPSIFKEGKYKTSVFPLKGKLWEEVPIWIQGGTAYEESSILKE